MPEIDILHVHYWSRDDEPTPDTVTIEKPDGTVVLDEFDDFDLGVLDRLGKDNGVTRWSERTDNDGLDLDSEVVIIGWADAPIGRDDVERSYHRSNDRPPMVNIKVQSFEIPEGDAFTELLNEFTLEPKLAALDPVELRERVERHLEKFDDTGEIFQVICEDHYELAKDDASEHFFPDYNIQVSTEGRSGGWLVVEGLPDVDTWGAKLLQTWKEFVDFCNTLVADIPRSMAWDVLANSQPELAGRPRDWTFAWVERRSDPGIWDANVKAYVPMCAPDSDTSHTLTVVFGELGEANDHTKPYWWTVQPAWGGSREGNAGSLLDAQQAAVDAFTALDDDSKGTPR
jgi:hypothetical protein